MVSMMLDDEQYCGGCGQMCDDVTRCGECMIVVCVDCAGRLECCWWCGYVGE